MNLCKNFKKIHLCLNRRKIKSKNNEDKMKENLKKLHAKRLFWRPNNKNALCWAFYSINDIK
jgi:hypothetical protein